MHNDGLEYFVIGSPKGQETAIYQQNNQGNFQKLNSKAFDMDKGFEDSRPIIFDANGDGHMDVVIGSTGYEFDEESGMYPIRLYLGNGKGDFQASKQAFGDVDQSVSVVVGQDIDNDGEVDLFVGGRDRPKRYPQPASSQLFVNDGKGIFTNKSSELAPILKDLGMVRDAMWTDLNGDKVNDLLIIGEWMNIKFLISEDGIFVDKSESMLVNNPSGWFNSITKVDIHSQRNKLPQKYLPEIHYVSISCVYDNALLDRRLINCKRWHVLLSTCQSKFLSRVIQHLG
jgi:hypothetical protein